MVKYREPGLGIQSEIFTRYTSSIKADREIINETILISIAHAIALSANNLIPRDAADNIIKALRELYFSEEEKDKLLSNDSFEDVFEAIEDYLESKIGDSAHYFPLGRSRNDHIAAVLRLKLASLTIEVLSNINELRKTIIALAKDHKNTQFVFHTHTMPAQVISYSRYLLAVYEELSDIFSLFMQDLGHVLKSPLGSGAGAGTSINLNKKLLAEIAGFKGVIANPLYATGSRLFINRTLSTLLTLSITMIRYINELILLSHPSIGILTIPEEHAQTSSLMPQKRNPATLEVARAKLKSIFGAMSEVYAIQISIPMGYSLDLQEASPQVWRAFKEAISSLKIVKDYIQKARVNKEKVAKLIFEGTSVATDIAETLSAEKSVPYRRAHAEVARALRESNWNIVEATKKIEDMFGINLSKLLNPQEALKMRESNNKKPNDSIDFEIELSEKRLEDDTTELQELTRFLEKTRRNLLGYE